MSVGKTRYFVLTFVIIVSVYSCLSEPDAPIVIGDISGTVLDAETFQAIPGVTIRTDPATSTVTSGADGKFQLNDLAEGDYTLTASRTGYNSASSEISVIAERVVNADIQLDPLASILVVNTSELNFGTATSNLNLQIQNGGYGTLSWTVSKNQPWLTVTPSSGSTETETDLINVAVDRTGYNPGNYSDIISIITNTNAASISALMVVPNTEGPQLTIAPDSYDFGSAESSHQFVVSNSGIGTLEWTAISNTSWLSMDVSSGTIGSGTNIINVTVDRFELQAGDYSGNISVSSNGGNQLINVSASVSTTAELIVSTSELDFENIYGELQVVLSNSTDIPLSWQAIPAQTWISVNPSQGIIETTPVVATITVNREALAIGTHTGSVDFIYAGGIASVAVQIDVTSVPLENPVLQITGQTGNSVTLGWTRPSNSTSFQRYDIRRSLEAGITEEVPVLTSISTYSMNTYTDASLSLSRTYYYRVYAVNSDGYGTPSNEISFTTDFAAPGTWVLQSTIGVYASSHDIYMINNSRGYAILDDKVYEYLGSSWDLMKTFDRAVYAIDGSGQNDIWVAGYYYDVWHYDGIAWTQQSDIPNGNIYDIEVMGEDNIWFGGGYSDPYLYHYDGSSYTEYVLNSDAAGIMDIQFISNDEGYALSEDGWIFYWNGIGWSSLISGDDQTDNDSYYKSLSVIGNGEIWICRRSAYYNSEEAEYYSRVIHYDGTNWNLFDAQTTSVSGYYDIYMVSETQGWVIGAAGQILFSGNGFNWSHVASPTTENLYDIYMLDADNGWAIGASGTILRYIGD